MITFKFSEQIPKKSENSKHTQTESEALRAETRRLAADLAKFRASLRYPPGSPEDLQQKAEEAAIKNVIAKHASGPDIDAMIRQYPWLSTQPAKSKFQLTAPLPAFGFRPFSLPDDEYKLRPPGEKNHKDKTSLQRQAATDAVVTTVPPVVHDTLASTGQPLDANTRRVMEGGFGQDFSRVRIHADAQAARSAQSIQAEAYTVGYDIVFAAGRYSPAGAEGRRLLAHELTHVLQQAGSSGSIPRTPRTTDRHSP